ncbi:MAG: DUF4349 domain-containing protein [Oscillospiraceae bacterium]|nr:DUF4349 domain-containing protein [Oscillospiraceae bacterium]
MKVRKLVSPLLVLLLLLSMTACGSSAKSEAMDMNAAGDVYYDAPMETMASLELKTESGTASVLPANRKLIRTIRMDAETEDLTTLLDSLTARITELGGYVESQELYNGSAYSNRRYRYLTVTVRIPAEKADEFVAQVGENANVVSSSETVDDVTLQYVDTESQIKALETEQARLIELLAQAQNLDEILQIEARLTDVRYELERYASYLRSLENQISYATIHLDITEVTEYTPVVEEAPTTWQRIGRGFGKSLQSLGKLAKELFIFIIVISPYLLVLAVLVTVTLVLRRRYAAKKRKKVLPPESEI